jgi:GAF domain-containing protein
MTNACSNSTACSDQNLPSYSTILSELEGLLKDERDWLVNLANTSALLNLRLPRLSWVGFYLWRGGELVLGPFQG